MNSSGNVGIGTTAPLSSLSVAGNLALGAYGGGASTIAAQSNGLIVSGSVGIGITSPTSLLDVRYSGNSSGTAITVGNATTGPYGRIGFANTTGIPFQIMGAGGDDLVLGASNTEYLRISASSGNVGIGATSPLFNLDVLDASSTTDVAILRRGVQGSDSNMITAFGTPYLMIGGLEYKPNSIQSIGFGYANGSSYQPAEIGFQTMNTSGETYGDIVFANRSVTTNTAPTEVMRITSAGNVGIGTTAPQSKLQIQAGEVQVGSSGASCAVANAGAIRYSAGVMYYCDNSNVWETIDSSGAVDTGDYYIATQTATSTSGQGMFGGNSTLGGVLAGYGSTADVTLENKTNGAVLEIPTGSVNVNIVSGGLQIGGNNAISFPQDTTTGGSIAIGYQALREQPLLTSEGYNNTAIGYEAMGTASLGTQGVDNTAVGSGALYSDTTGNHNTAVGGDALYSNTAGSSNTGNGFFALYYNSVGNENTAFGVSALKSTTGYNSTAVGGNAAVYTIGSYNTVVGYQAGEGVNGTSTYTNAVLLGYQAGYNLTSGSNNIIIDSIAPTTGGITTGSSNISIGQGLTALTVTSSNQLDIGNLIFGTGVSSGGTISTGSVGIGTASPQGTLDVYANSGHSLTVNSSTGYVGIGVTAPNDKLEVSGASNTYTRVTSPSTSFDAGVRFNNENISGFVGALGGSGCGTSNVSIYNAGCQFNVGSNGNVGIGLTNPTYPLQVSSPTTNATFEVNSGNTAGTAIFLHNWSGGGGIAHDMEFFTTGSGNSPGEVGVFDVTSAKVLLTLNGINGGAAIGTYAVATTALNTPTNGLIVSGNVGIGTTSPQSELQVAGGEVQVGSSSNSCASVNNGAIRFSGTTLYYCTGTTWTSIGGGGGSGTVTSRRLIPLTQVALDVVSMTGLPFLGRPRTDSDGERALTCGISTGIS